MSSIPVTLWSFYRSLPERLHAANIEVHICTSKGTELDFFSDKGITTWPVKINRTISPLQDLFSLFRLFRLFRKQGFSIVHAHTPKAGLLGMLAARLAGVSERLYTCHGLPMETETGLRRWILQTCEKISFACSTKSLVVSNSLLNRVHQYGIYNGKKAQVLENGTACGVDLKRFTKTPSLERTAQRLRQHLGIREDEVVVGFIGRLVPDKGIGTLLEAFSDLCNEHPDTHLVLIGDYEPHRGLLSSKHKQMLCNHEKITHLRFTTEIEQYYTAMDMLVLPTKREGFPYTLLEAGAMALPVVATRVTGCLDAVVDGQTGLLVQPDHPFELAEAMKRLVRNRDLRQELGKAGRKRVEQKFTVEILLESHLSLYKTLLNQ